MGHQPEKNIADKPKEQGDDNPNGLVDDTSKKQRDDKRKEQLIELKERVAEKLFSRKGELVLGILAAIFSMFVVGFFAQDSWFYGDAWDFLTMRRIDSLDSLLRPHAGHLVTPAVILYRLLYGLVGMDYWPWYFIPRLIGYAAMVFVVWRMLRWRGADPVIAFGVYLVLLFFRVSGFHTVATTGTFIVNACFLGVVWLIFEKQAPTNRDRYKLLTLFLVAFLASTTAIAWFVGVVIGLLWMRRLRAWWPALAAPFGGYLAWYLIFGASARATPSLSLRTALSFPGQSLNMLSTTLTHLFPVPEAYVPALGVLLIVAVVWLFHTGRMGPYEGIFFTALAVFLAMIILVRVSAGTAPITAGRYTHFPTFMLVLALVPHIKFSKKSVVYVGVIGVLLITGLFNVVHLRSGLLFWKNRSQNSRLMVETCATLLEAGEPALPRAGIDFRAGMLRVAGLQRLVDEGWNPPGSSDPELISEARGRLRMALSNRGRLHGEKPTTQVLNPRSGCTIIRSGTPWSAQIHGTGTISLQAPKGTPVDLRWDDAYGRGNRKIIFGQQRMQTQIYITFAEPSDVATFSLEVSSEANIRICGLAPAGAVPPPGN